MKKWQSLLGSEKIWNISESIPPQKTTTTTHYCMIDVANRSEQIDHHALVCSDQCFQITSVARFPWYMCYEVIYDTAQYILVHTPT